MKTNTDERARSRTAKEWVALCQHVHAIADESPRITYNIGGGARWAKVLKHARAIVAALGREGKA